MRIRTCKHHSSNAVITHFGLTPSQPKFSRLGVQCVPVAATRVGHTLTMRFSPELETFSRCAE